MDAVTDTRPPLHATAGEAYGAYGAGPSGSSSPVDSAKPAQPVATVTAIKCLGWCRTSQTYQQIRHSAGKAMAKPSTVAEHRPTEAQKTLD